jgi:polyisoprenoid-binding protein YceI
MHMRSAWALGLLLSAAATVAVADEPPRTFAVDPAASEVVYHLVHKLHHVDGRTHRVDGRAALTADGRAQVELRLPLESFDSGNVNRDAHMKEVLETAKFPTLELKALCPGMKLPAAGQSQIVPCKAQIDLHGIKQIQDIKVEVTPAADGSVRAVSHFAVSLDAFKIERPSLMFVKVDDAVEIDAKVNFKKQ